MKKKNKMKKTICINRKTYFQLEAIQALIKKIIPNHTNIILSER